MSMTCHDAASQLLLRPELPNAALAAHLDDCPRCARAAAWHAGLDTALRGELVLCVPPDLTARLLATIPAVMAGQPVRTRRWERQRRLLTVGGGLLGLLSAFVLLLGVQWLAAQLGLPALLASLAGWPGLLVEQLYVRLPASRHLVEALLRLREPAQWLLAAAVLWLALDRTQPGQLGGGQLA